MSVARRGVILLEVVAACGLMAVLVAVCLQMLAVTTATRRTVERRAIALQEAANLLERASALSWQDITPERLTEIDIAPSVREILPGAVARWSVKTPAEPGPPATQVRVEITWINPAGQTDVPVRLSYWMYAAHVAPGESKP